MFYSAKNNAFYAESLNAVYKSAGSWPKDALQISDEEYQRLLNGQSNGMCIIAGINGLPELTEPSEPTREELMLQAESKKTRLMEEVDVFIIHLERAIRLGMATEGEKSRLEALERYSVALSRVDINAPHWPEVPGDVA